MFHRSNKRHKRWNAMPLFKLTYPLSNNSDSISMITFCIISAHFHFLHCEISLCCQIVWHSISHLNWWNFIIYIKYLLSKKKNEMNTEKETKKHRSRLIFTIVWMTNGRTKELKVLISLLIVFDDAVHKKSSLTIHFTNVSLLRNSVITVIISHLFNDSVVSIDVRVFLFFHSKSIINYSVIQWIHVTKPISKLLIST